MSRSKEPLEVLQRPGIVSDRGGVGLTLDPRIVAPFGLVVTAPVSTP